jgi:hypothetical protein
MQNKAPRKEVEKIFKLGRTRLEHLEFSSQSRSHLSCTTLDPIFHVKLQVQQNISHKILAVKLC